MRYNSAFFLLLLSSEKASSDKLKQTLRYLVLALVTILPLSALFVIVHEYIHSITAWLLDAKEDPMIIQWGNPVTLAGWDEAVCYSCLFDSGRGTVAAIIAASPLIFQAAVFIVCLYLLLGKRLMQKRLLFHLVYWVAIINFMKLFTYIAYDSFALHGDIGNINRGLGLSPWLLFPINVTLVLAGIYLLFVRVLPKMNVLVAEGNPLTEMLILIVSAFIFFRLGDVIWEMASLYPDPQWMIGLIGLAGFALVVSLCWPTRRWIIERERVVSKNLKIRGGP
jgi:hypothetical protein